MPLPDPVLDVRDVGKAFSRRPVLSGVSFRVDAGSIVAVTGTNGAGKSTLLRAVAGLARCSGTVLVGGRPAGHPEVRRRIAYLPQATDLPDWATVSEVLDLFARLRGVEAATAVFPPGFVPAGDARVGTLSGGQRRRVALAGTLLGEPDLLLLDEPAANLDDHGTTQLRTVLADLRAQGRTVLVATPSASEMTRLADRVLELVDGRLTADTPARASRARPQAGILPVLLAETVA